MKSKLAGMTAQSSANPYLVLTINTGESDPKHTRLFFEREYYVENDLNPQFFKSFDLDAQFPDDWKLTVKVMDKGLFRDQLIGQTVIDVENRLYANQFYMNKHAMAIEEKEIELTLKDKKRMKGPEGKKLKKKMN